VQGLVALGKISSDEEEMKKCFTLIGERIKAQEFFINEIIDIYRNNRVELKLEKIQLKKLTEEIVEETSFTPGVDDIRFKIEINDNLEFVSDKIRLKSLMFNLIGNAIKYHDPQKSNKFIKVSATRSGEFVLINIEDNGKGIGEEHLPKIFNMFYRASTDSKGSGLGLYIVKEAVAKLKGTITAESELGKGTKFTLRFSIH
jgi:signal transduction histidine kinase